MTVVHLRMIGTYEYMIIYPCVTTRAIQNDWRMTLKHP
jgi:hypothetical protein